MATDAIARVLGHAVTDAKFAQELHHDPATAARRLGVHLGPNEIAAMKDISPHQLGAVGDTVRHKLNVSALLEQQQQQVRMD